MMREVLEQALGNCKRLETCECVVKSSYELTSLPEFFVYDDKDEKHPIRIVGFQDEWQLKAENGVEKEITVVKTDKCLVNANDLKKCDCIFFSDDKFFLVEIKTGGMGTRGSKRKDAVEQLGATITLLHNNNVDLITYETKAIICFKSNSTYPTRASQNSQRAIFLSEYGISLEEGNTISF